VTEVRDTAVVERVWLIVDERDAVVVCDGVEPLVNVGIVSVFGIGEPLDVLSVVSRVASRRYPLVDRGGVFVPVSARRGTLYL